MSGLGLLPAGWFATPLETIATWGSGGTPSRKTAAYYGGNVPWIKTGDLGDRVVTNASEFITDEAVKNSSAKWFPKGSVVLAMYGATIGKTSILGLDATTNQACGVGHPIEGATFTAFLYYLLRNEKDAFIAKGKGGAQPNISQALIKTHEIALPPLAEQKVIADKLDELLAQVESTKARLDAIPAILKSFRQSVLAAAVSGKLTKEWRGENEIYADNFIKDIQESRFTLWKETELNKYQEKGKQPHKNWISKYNIPENNEEALELPTSWGCLTWAEISMWITYGFTKPMPHVESGPLIITAKNVRHSEISLEGAHHTTDEAFQGLRPKDKPSEGDLLIVKDGATTGRASLSPEGIGDYCISQSVAVVWLKYSPLNRKYLLWCVQSDNTQKRIQDVMAGMAMPHLSITDFGKMQVPIPPAEEMEEIVRRVEDLFSFADKVETQVNAAQLRVNNLTQSILAKAFRGELTADWRTANPELISADNSAEALLKRIKTEREALAKSTKGAKKKPAKKVSAKKTQAININKNLSPVESVIADGIAHKPQDIFDKLTPSLSMTEVFNEISKLLSDNKIEEKTVDGITGFFVK
ncbi:MAG: type I restriction enzyme S subunit [Oleiphilaceae bacterium]|jgi:type I restriction enzyme S subunit